MGCIAPCKRRADTVIYRIHEGSASIPQLQIELGIREADGGRHDVRVYRKGGRLRTIISYEQYVTRTQENIFKQDHHFIGPVGLTRGDGPSIQVDISIGTVDKFQPLICRGDRRACPIDLGNDDAPHIRKRNLRTCKGNEKDAREHEKEEWKKCHRRYSRPHACNYRYISGETSPLLCHFLLFSLRKNQFFYPSERHGTPTCNPTSSS